MTHLVTIITLLLAVELASGQTPPAEKAPLAEQVFTNVRVLRGIPVDEFMGTMGFFSASLGMSCEDCHGASDTTWENYARDVSPKKATARRMIQMMTSINQTSFGGRTVVTCYTCHRGGNRPKMTASLAALYGASPPEEADDVIASPARGAPSAGQILDKYLNALGGADRLTRVTSIAAKGTYEAYTDRVKHPVEIFAKAPGQRATIVHAPDGNITTIYDGRNAWIGAPLNERPVPVLALAGGDLDAARLEAALAFPARIKQTLSAWRTGLPTTVDDRDVQVVQGTTAGRLPATFYFDAESGLLVRLVRYADSAVGRIPLQTDYADYRDVSGVKMPFKWTSTWLDGRSTIELSDVRVGVPIAAGAFAKPAR